MKQWLSKLKPIFLGKLKHKNYLNIKKENIQYAIRKNRSIPFKIIKIKSKGLIVKVNGLYGFLSYNYMCWSYPNFQYWATISKHLVGCRFLCNIFRFSDKTIPFTLIINAECHKFKPIKLIEGQEYQGIVLQVSKYGLFIDLGFHYKWEYGSFVSLFHKSGYFNNDLYLNAKAGDVVPIIYHGKSKDGKILVGNQYFQSEWYKGELDHFIGTTKKAILMLNEEGNRQFFIEGLYKTTVILPKVTIKTNKIKIKKALKTLNLYTEINCNIIKITKNNTFLAELTVNEIEALLN